MSEWLFFGGFLVFVFIILLIDLGVINKKSKEISPKQALGWTILWVSLALGFFIFLRFYGSLLHNISSINDLQNIAKSYGQDFAIDPSNFALSLNNYNKLISIEFLTAYLVEESLSLDNLFVILLVFNSFGVKKDYYHSVLFWGILGAIFFRFIFIFTGAALVARFSWILYLFAAFLVYAGVKLLLSSEESEEIDTVKHPMVRFASKFFPIYKNDIGDRFFIKVNKKYYISSLFVVLLVVEFSDLVFAVDSIPAVFAVTQDPYIVFFSNIFAILGLRSIFFLIQSLFGKLRFFKLGLSSLLLFIGLKMLGEHWLSAWGFSTVHSLYIILGILTLSISGSLLFPKQK